MKLYSCKVRIGGNVLNEVRKENATAAEIVLMRAIHGDDAVLEIEATGKVDRSDADERSRLLEAQFDTEVMGRVFGHSALGLPQEIAGVKDNIPGDGDAPIRRRAARAAALPAEEADAPASE